MSVVIPATDDPSTLARCRAAVDVAAGAVPDRVEVIEVTGPAALSAAAARNAGVRRATGDVIVFVDADVEVRADALARVHGAFADDTLSAVFGSYDDDPADRSTVSAFRNLLHHHVHQTNAGPVDTFWTGLGAIRRSAFVAVGGFDEDRYPHPSVEDIDLGDRLARAGARIRLDPAVQGTHLKRWTLLSMIHTDFARRALPWIAMQVANRRVSASLNLGWRHRISALAAVAIVVSIAAMALHLPLGTGALLVAGGVLVGLNADLYGLLTHRMGVARGVAGIGLHLVHHLVAVAAVPVGLATALAAAGRGPVDAMTLAVDIEEAA